MKWTKHDTLSATLLLLLVIIFFFRLFWPIPSVIFTPDYGKSDAWDFSFSTKYVLAQRLAQHNIPLWTDAVGNGFPLYSEGQTGVFFLPNLLFFSLFDAVTGYNVALVFSVITAGLGMYIWLRLLRLPPFTALFGGLTLSLSGVILAQLTHITLLQSFTLAPWVMAVTLLLMRSPSWKKSLLLSVLFAQQALTGFPQGMFITVCVSFSYVLFFMWHTKRYTNSLYYIGAFIPAFGLAAVQLLPSAEFLNNILDPHGFSLFGATQYAYPLVHLKTFLDPFALGDPSRGTYQMRTWYPGSIFWENSGYIGILPLIFTALALITRKQFPGKKYYIFLAVIALFLMLGSASPLYILYSFWPFNLFRVPSRFIWVLVFVLIICASYGLTMLLRKIEHKKLRFVLFSLFLIIQYGQLSHTWWKYHAIVPAHEALARPQMTDGLTTSNRIYTIGAQQQQSAFFMQSGWQNNKPYLFLKNSLTANSNVLWGIPNHDIYAGRLLRRGVLFDSLLTGEIQVGNDIATISAQGAKLLNLAGVDTVISTAAIHDEQLVLTKTVTDKYITLYRYHNPNALPRVYTASYSTVASTAQAAAKAIFNPSFEPGKTVLVEENINDQFASPSGSVNIQEATQEKVVITLTNHPNPSFVVLADTYYPGWNATIDGKNTPIYPANISQRAVVAPAGNHVIVFSYHPTSFTLGAWITTLTWIFVIWQGGFPLVVSVFQIVREALAHAFHPSRNHDR